MPTGNRCYCGQNVLLAAAKNRPAGEIQGCRGGKVLGRTDRSGPGEADGGPGYGGDGQAGQRGLPDSPHQCVQPRGRDLQQSLCVQEAFSGFCAAHVQQ